jgi:hypothetical protein
MIIEATPLSEVLSGDLLEKALTDCPYSFGDTEYAIVRGSQILNHLTNMVEEVPVETETQLNTEKLFIINA